MLVGNRPLILCADSDPAALDLIAFNLKAEGFEVAAARNGEEALSEAAGSLPALILLDMLLPETGGVELCRRLKRAVDTSPIPVVMLAERDSEEDRIRCFDSGADDYIPKPFSMRELIARINAKLRRLPPGFGRDGVTYVGPLVIDGDNYVAACEGEILPLTLKEFELLRAMACAPGKIFSRSQLLRLVWSYDDRDRSRTVDVHINHIRAKLKDNADIILTVRGKGYMLKNANAMSWRPLRP